MELLGRRIRARRRQLRLTQKDLATATTSSFISRIERGKDFPSLQVLRTIAQSLLLTAGELLGDHLLLEAAKLSVLDAEQCQLYLNHLPETSITRYLASLTACSQNASKPIPSPPPDPEMHFLAALVALQRHNEPKAREFAAAGIKLNPMNRPLTKVKLQALLQNLTAGLGQPCTTPASIVELLRRIQGSTSARLPHPESITYEDVASAQLLQVLSLLCKYPSK